MTDTSSKGLSPELVEAGAKALYENTPDSGYDEDEPKTYWMAEDGWWPPSTKMCVWDAWRDAFRAALSAALPILREQERKAVLREMQNWRVDGYQMIDRIVIGMFAKAHGLDLDGER